MPVTEPGFALRIGFFAEKSDPFMIRLIQGAIAVSREHPGL
jgi:hypothetical protein